MSAARCCPFQLAINMHSVVRRYGLCAPLAGGVTLILGAVMQSAVATEFIPQLTDRASTISAANIYNQIIISDGDKKQWEWPQAVKPPPAIPRLPIEQEPIFEIISEPLEWREEGTVDTKRPPLVRIPPRFPTRFLKGDVSGYCHVRFDVSPNGQPYNVVTVLCTNSDLERPTIISVQKWRYAPKIQNGRAVMQSGVEATVRFDLMDENGVLLPLPEGY